MHWTAVWLIRHGHTIDNTPGPGARLSGWFDAPLSELGVRQAKLLADRLHGRPVAALYTSSLLRARQTAERLATAWDMPPVDEPGLREISCGALEGWPLVEIQRRFPALWQRNLAQADDSFRWPGGESYAEFRVRVLATVHALASRHDGQSIALVTHAGVISQVFGALHHTSAARWELWRPRNGSLSEVWLRDMQTRAIGFDWRPSGAPEQVGAA